MTLYQTDLIQIFFGDKKTAVYPDEVRGKTDAQLSEHPAFQTIMQAFPVPLTSFVFFHQTHGIKGDAVTSETTHLPLFTHEGDFLVTDLLRVGIGVATADCLPIVIVDPRCRAVAIVHAGWRGLVGGIVEQAIERLQREYHSLVADLRFVMGPSAKQCCYEVGKDFFEQVSTLYPERAQPLRDTLAARADSWFFDNQRFLKLILAEKGVVEEALDFSCAQCTLCEQKYCSYRREKMSPLRQLTLVSLK